MRAIPCKTVVSSAEAKVLLLGLPDREYAMESKSVIPFGDCNNVLARLDLKNGLLRCITRCRSYM